MESGLLDSFVVEPPCTTFSPALGTTLALRALTLMWIANQVAAPALLEQPRKTKMRRLSEWEFLVKSGLLEELVTASCNVWQHPSQGVFVPWPVFWMGKVFVAHVRETMSMPPPQESGQPSATYMDELACIIAYCFSPCPSPEAAL